MLIVEVFVSSVDISVVNVIVLSNTNMPTTGRILAARGYSGRARCDADHIKYLLKCPFCPSLDVRYSDTELRNVRPPCYNINIKINKKINKKKEEIK